MAFNPFTGQIYPDNDPEQDPSPIQREFQALKANPLVQGLTTPIQNDPILSGGPPVNTSPAPAQAPAPAAAPEAAPPFQFPQGQPPPWVVESKTQSGGTRRTIVSANEKRLAEESAKRDEGMAKQVVDTAKQNAAADESAAQQIYDQRSEVRTQHEKVRNDAMQAADAQLKQRMSRYAEMESKLDKMELREFWADKTTGQKVMAGIAVALGALGGAMTGRGQNLALQTLEGAIERDKQMQLSRIALEEKKLARAGAGIEELRKFRDDAIRMVDIKEAKALDKIADQVTMFAAKSGGRDKIAAAEQLATQFHTRADGTRLRVAEAERVDAQGQWAKVVKHQDPMNALGGAAVGADRIVVGPDGKQYIGRTEAESKELRKKSADLEAAKQTAERIKALNSQRGRMPDAALERQIKTEVDNLLRAQKEITGAQTEGDRENAYNKFVPGLVGGAWNGPEPYNKAVDAFVSGLDTSFGSSLKSSALEAPQVGGNYAWNPKQKEFVTSANAATTPQQAPAQQAAPAPAAGPKLEAGERVGTFKGRRIAIKPDGTFRTLD